MFVGYFTERPYQDPASGYFGSTGLPIRDLDLSNDIYDSVVGAELYNRYMDEKVYAEEMGFDGLMLNPESTEGVGRVSVLKRQEGAPLNLG